MFVTPDQLVEFTGKTRPSAQARFLDARQIRYTRRDDGSIALRTEELDRHTLSGGKSAAGKAWRVDLSQFHKTG